MKNLIVLLFTVLSLSTVALANNRDHNRYNDRGRHADRQFCRQTNSSNGYEFYNDGPDFERASYRKVWDGAELEILGYDTVYYKGVASNGISFRVIKNYNTGGDAGRGEILWDYVQLFHCQ